MNVSFGSNLALYFLTRLQEGSLYPLLMVLGSQKNCCSLKSLLLKYLF